MNHEVLKWAIGRAGHSPETVAEKLKTDPAEVLAWCTGVDTPSYPVLERLAYTVLRIPLAVFYLPSPPRIPDPTTKFRRLAPYDSLHLTPDTRRLIREAYGYQLSLKEFYRHLDTPPKLWRQIQPRGLSPSQIATHIRRELDITVEEQQDQSSNDAAFKWWRRRLEGRGVFTFKESFDDIYISGLSLLDPEFPVVLVNNSTPFTRQIFTLAHEVAHIILGVDGVTDLDERYMPTLGDEDRRLEIRCNAIAAEILVPSQAFRDDAGTFDPDDPDAIPRMATKYRVSREVILRRLKDADVLPHDEYERLLAEWRRGFTKRGSDSSGGNYYLTKLAYLGEGFTRLAFVSHLAGRINRIQLADHLNVKVRNLDKLQRHVRI